MVNSIKCHLNDETHDPEKSVMYKISTWGEEAYIYENDYKDYRHPLKTSYTTAPKYDIIRL